MAKTQCKNSSICSLPSKLTLAPKEAFKEYVDFSNVHTMFTCCFWPKDVGRLLVDRNCFVSFPWCDVPLAHFASRVPWSRLASTSPGQSGTYQIHHSERQTRRNVQTLPQYEGFQEKRPFPFLRMSKHLKTVKQLTNYWFLQMILFPIHLTGESRSHQSDISADLWILPSNPIGSSA